MADVKANRVLNIKFAPGFADVELACRESWKWKDEAGKEHVNSVKTEQTFATVSAAIEAIGMMAAKVAETVSEEAAKASTMFPVPEEHK